MEEEEQQAMCSIDKEYMLKEESENERHCKSGKVSSVIIVLIMVIVLLSVILRIKRQNTLSPQISLPKQIEKAKSYNNSNKQSNNILHNPYNDDTHSYISQEQISQAKTRKDMLDHDATLTQQLSTLQREYYQNKYHIDHYPQLPFCIIVPTFNNKLKRRNIRNIRSIVNQDYKGFRLIVIDDASVDGTVNDIQDYLKRKNVNQEYKIIKNQKRLYSLANIHRAAQEFCRQQEIMMVIDGDDELIGRQVLKLFNAVFQEKKVWLAYSNSLTSTGKIGYSRPYHPDIIEHNDYRYYDFTVSHLRAYYTKLFLKVKRDDLLDQNGNYLQSAGDMAACVPMLQMSHHKISYIPEITYLYNTNTGLNVHKNRLSQQRANSQHIRSRPPYTPLIQLFPI